MAENTGMASLARHAGFVVSHQMADDLLDMRLVLNNELRSTPQGAAYA